MTIREFYLSVLDLADTDSATDPSMTFNGQTVVDISNKASELLAALDAKNEKRKGTETKEKKEAEARKLAVLDFFYDHQSRPMTRDDIATALGITPAQVSAACKPLLEERTITKAEAKIGKSRKVVYIMPREE